MTQQCKDVIEELIISEAESIQNLDAEDYKNVANGLAKVIEAQAKAEAAELEMEMNREMKQADLDLKAEELDLKRVELEQEAKRDKWAKVQTCAEIGISVLGLGVYLWCVVKGFELEETGTFTTKTLPRMLSKSPRLKV